MLVAIVSLSVVILLVIALHVYVRCVLRRQARRRAAIRQLGLTVAHARSSQQQQPKIGLDPTVIASLPMFAFKQRDEGDHHDDASSTSATECAVCLSILENEEMARLLPNCKHIFHAECIDKWLGSHSTCPICRTEANPLVQPVPREGPAGLAGGSTAPTAPILGSLQNSGFSWMAEGTSHDGFSQSTEKAAIASTSRLDSFKRILSRERSSRRSIPSRNGHEDHDAIGDLERQ